MAKSWIRLRQRLRDVGQVPAHLDVPLVDVAVPTVPGAGPVAALGQLRGRVEALPIRVVGPLGESRKDERPTALELHLDLVAGEPAAEEEGRPNIDAVPVHVGLREVHSLHRDVAQAAAMRGEERLERVELPHVAAVRRSG